MSSFEAMRSRVSVVLRAGAVCLAAAVLMTAGACAQAAQNPLSAVLGNMTGQSQQPQQAAPATASPQTPAPSVPQIQTAPVSGVPGDITTSGQTPTLSAPTPVTGAPPAFSQQFPPAVITANDGTTATIFGASLFTGAFSGSVVSDNGNYVVQAGDIIDVKTFGNLSLDVVARVNGDGRLFLPVVGPIQVAGVTRAKLNSTLQSALSAVYTNIQVYADIVQPGAVGVYVTGDVMRPGRYLGTSNDNLLYYLDKAGGIDGQRGSFRDVVVRRAHGPDAHYDLYDFLRNGNIAPAKMADGDVIVVKHRGPLVVVTGMALNSFAFELRQPEEASSSPDPRSYYPNGQGGAGAEIIDLAKPNARRVTNVYVHNTKQKELTGSYVNYTAFPAMALGEGDHVDFRSDTVSPTITVTLLAQLRTPSVFVVQRGTTLKEVLATISVEGSNVDPKSTYIIRSSVAAAQKRMLAKSLLILQEDAYAASALTIEGIQAQGSSLAPLVQQFVNAAQQVQPTGQLAVYHNDELTDVHLEDGDQIVIPEKSDVVTVAGEVLGPGGFAHRRRATIKDYIDDAGGFTEAADTSKFVLHKLNGSSRVVDEDAVPEPGDEVLVVPAVSGQGFQLVKDISTLLFQIALTTATVVKL